MSEHARLYRGRRFPREVIAYAVRLYRRFALSFRNAEELRWRAARLGRTWSFDEMATRVGGRVHWLWRAVDEHGQTLDVLLQARRDTAAAERFFRRLLAAADRLPPDRTTTDKLGSYAAALPRGPAMHAAERGQVRAARRCTFSRVGNRLGPRRLLLTAAAYGVTMRERVATWREGAGLRAT